MVRFQKVAWVLYSERCVRVVVTEKFWKNLKLSKYFNKSTPCHTSLPDQLNLDRHSLRPVSKSLENALSSLGFTRTKDNFRNSDSLLNYYHIVFLEQWTRKIRKKCTLVKFAKKFNQTRFRLVEERGSSTFNGKVSTEFWIWTTKFGELSSCIQNHNMVMHSMHIADIFHDRHSQPSVVYFFQAGIFFGRTNATFWPGLANLSQILLFTGLYSAVVYQNWQISGMSMHNSASCVHWRGLRNVCLFKN